MRFMQTESVLQNKNRSEPAKNRFSVALIVALSMSLLYLFVQNIVQFLYLFLKFKWLKLMKSD